MKNLYQKIKDTALNPKLYTAATALTLTGCGEAEIYTGLGIVAIWGLGTVGILCEVHQAKKIEKESKFYDVFKKLCEERQIILNGTDEETGKNIQYTLDEVIKDAKELSIKQSEAVFQVFKERQITLNGVNEKTWDDAEYSLGKLIYQAKKQAGIPRRKQ